MSGLHPIDQVLPLVFAFLCNMNGLDGDLLYARSQVALTVVQVVVSSSLLVPYELKTSDESAVCTVLLTVHTSVWRCHLLCMGIECPGWSIDGFRH